MTTNFARPIISDPYADVLTTLTTAINDLARGLAPDTTEANGAHTVVPVGAVRWNASSARWERFNGSSWPPLATKYAIAVTGADTAGTATHVAGGAAGSIPFQSGAGATSFLQAGSAGALLTMLSNGLPSWMAASLLTVGYATTATHLSGGNISTAENTVNTTSASDSNVVVNGSTSQPAQITFRRGVGGYRIKVGLEVDQTWRVGYGSDGNNYRYAVDSAGNFTARGDVTAFSDERLKSDWRAMPEGWLRLLANVKAGTYTRIDNFNRQAGVSAQDLQCVLPEAVHEEADGFLTVAYGQAALVACVELAREVAALRAEVAALRG